MGERELEGTFHGVEGGGGGGGRRGSRKQQNCVTGLLSTEWMPGKEGR